MAQAVGNARNILVGASPLFLSTLDSTAAGYDADMEAGVAKAGTVGGNNKVPAFASGVSYTDTLNAQDARFGDDGAYRNVGYTNNGLQITYNPTYDSVTVDQLLDTAKLFKSAMEVMIATEMSEGTLENVLVVFGQGRSTLDESDGTKDVLGLEAGALGAAPTERQLIAVGQAPGTDVEGNTITRTERVYYARRVLSVQQSQFSLARTAPTTFPVTFRLLPSGDAAHAGKEYGLIIDRVVTA
jgi:hypothetical protein